MSVSLRVIVVVLTHQVEYLDEALVSIGAQSVPPDGIVVVDNASPGNEVGEITDEHGGVPVRLDRPLTPAVARNVGVAASGTTDYVVNLDGDDILLPTFIERHRSAAVEGGADVVYSCAELFGAQTGSYEKIRRRPLRSLGVSNFVPANAMFSRQIWSATGGFDPDVGLYADWDFWLSCARAGGRFVFIPDVLWRYRRHDSSQVATSSQTATSESRDLIRAKHAPYLDGIGGWRRQVGPLGRHLAANRVRQAAVS